LKDTIMTTEYESMAGSPAGVSGTTPWSEEVARRVAAEKGLGELTESHWRVIHTLRAHFVQYGALPPMRLACGLNRLEPDCTEALFRGAHEAWQVAGLPEPGSESSGYL
jgi:sulfur relay (sulfurtransferase) DsrC/TusE family protein